MTVEPRRVAIVLDLDDVAAAAVRQITESVALNVENRGMTGASVPPHVTMAACRNLDVERFRVLVAELAAQTEAVATTLAAIGVFLSEEGVIFLAPSMTQALVELHVGILSRLQDLGAEIERYWLPGQWVPHCTLATGISPDRMSTAVSRLYEALHPISARLTRLSVVEIESPRLLYAFDLSG